MTSAVLYDVPGPRTRRRHRIGSGLGGIVVAAILVLVVWKLAKEGQFTAAMWEAYTNPLIWTHALLDGLASTLRAAIVAIALALAFGAVFCAGRLSEHAIIRVPSVIVIEFFRAIPLVLLILFLFLAYGARLGTFWPLVLALMLYNGSVLAETFRAGINAVPRGQSEAAYSIGLRKRQVMMLVLIPQAVRSMLPAIISQCVVALKDTSLGYIISYQELVSAGKRIFQAYHNILPTTFVLAAIYIVLCFSLSQLAVYLEERQRRQGGHPVEPVIPGTNEARVGQGDVLGG